MPSKARCWKCSPGCGTEENRISSSFCPTAAAPTFPLLGPTLRPLPRVASPVPRSWPLHRTCYACASVLIGCCAGSNKVRAHNKLQQLRRANMQRQQLELWSAEPHPTPPLYQQLTPPQRSRLVNHLAGLILKMVQENVTLAHPLNPLTSTQTKDHER